MKQVTKDELGIIVLAMLMAAEKAKERAYVKYSNYPVGAAILDNNDNIWSGCNVENAIFIVPHAETNAISRMIVEGGTQIKAVLCITENGGASCGYCRQLIWEHCKNDKNVPIYLLDKEGNGMVVTIGELLPYAFEL